MTRRLDQVLDRFDTYGAAGKLLTAAGLAIAAGTATAALLLVELALLGWLWTVMTQ